MHKWTRFIRAETAVLGILLLGSGCKQRQSAPPSLGSAETGIPRSTAGSDTNELSTPKPFGAGTPDGLREALEKEELEGRNPLQGKWKGHIDEETILDDSFQTCQHPILRAHLDIEMQIGSPKVSAAQEKSRY